MAEERRRASRRARRLHVVILATSDGDFLSEATVGDLAHAGARLRLHRNVALPDVLIVADPAGDRFCLAHVVWRRGHGVGLSLESWRNDLSRERTATGALVRDLYALG